MKNEHRRYLCRAKRLDNREWIIGNLIIDYITGKYFIHAEEF